MIGCRLDFLLIIEVCANGTHLHRTSKPRIVTLPMAVIALAETEAMFVSMLIVNEIRDDTLLIDYAQMIPDDCLRTGLEVLRQL